MAITHADPAEIRKFASMLKAFTHDLANNTRMVQAQFQHLEHAWRDPQHRHFADDFEHMFQLLRRFEHSATAQIPLLHRTAQHLEAFLATSVAPAPPIAAYASGSSAQPSDCTSNIAEQCSDVPATDVLTSVAPAPPIAAYASGSSSHSSGGGPTLHTTPPFHGTQFAEWFFLKSALEGVIPSGWSWVGWSTRNQGRPAHGLIGEVLSKQLLQEMYALQPVAFNQPYHGFDGMLSAPAVGYIILESKVNQSGHFHPGQTQHGAQGSPTWIARQIERMSTPGSKAYSPQNAAIAATIRRTGVDQVPVVTTVIHPETGAVNIYYRAPGCDDWQYLPAKESLLAALKAHTPPESPTPNTSLQHLWQRARDCTSKIAATVGLTVCMFATQVVLPAHDIVNRLHLDWLFAPPTVLHIDELDTTEQCSDVPATDVLTSQQQVVQNQIDQAVADLSEIQQAENERRRQRQSEEAEIAQAAQSAQISLDQKPEDKRSMSK
ncbi:MAG: hypothetical protein HC837_18845 [Chloroflexaceae bacterium]|nr:hypothetical protein [Chloroflexaceae bacterium]